MSSATSAKRERTFLRTDEIMQRLRKTFAPPAYALLEQVGNGTGARNYRWADALAMSLWPSRGLSITGFEVKASRSDWVKELRDPGKSEEILSYCDHWYLVVGDPEIVQPGELPPTWGLLIPGRTGMTYKVQAPPLTPKPIDRAFLAAIFRRASEQSVDAKLINAARDEGFAEGRKTSETIADGPIKALEKLKAEVAAFEQASGVVIQRGWDGKEKIGKAVREVMDGTHERRLRELPEVRERLARVVEFIDRELGKGAAT